MTTGIRADDPRSSATTPTTLPTATAVTTQPCHVTGRHPKPVRRRRNHGVPVKRCISSHDMCFSGCCMSHRGLSLRLRSMGAIDMNAELWASLGTAVATIVFLVVPVLVYAWYALDEWIGDRESYAEVISAVEHR